MADPKEYTINAHIRARDSESILTRNGGELPSGTYINNPETHGTDEGFARDLVFEIAGRAPSLEYTRRHLGARAATFYFVFDQPMVVLVKGYGWHEPIESAARA